MMDKKKAADMLDTLIGMVEDSNGADYDTALRMGIEALSAQPEIIACGQGELVQDGSRLVQDCIDRQAAVDAALDSLPDDEYWNEQVKKAISALPSARPEIIRCKDCRWWDKYGDYDNGYCMAAKHGYWSEHWEISIRRTYKGDFYCADAEMRGEQDG